MISFFPYRDTVYTKTFQNARCIFYLKLKMAEIYKNSKMVLFIRYISKCYNIAITEIERISEKGKEKVKQ